MLLKIKNADYSRVSESAKANYLNNTENISTNYLIDAISLVNNCEINLKM